MAKSNFKKYKKKRDFDKSPEPKGSEGSSGSSRFVIHKHDASNLHYDFRLEIDEALKSWAIPKGPSTDPKDKRLAIPTEDHPLDYFDFEGVIPEGQYGAGTVMVWDTGVFRNLLEEKENGKSLKESYEDGKMEVWLEGQKVSGGYAIIKMGNDDNWLMIKMEDKEADARRKPVKTEKPSVKTERSMADIEKEESDD